MASLVVAIFGGSAPLRAEALKPSRAADSNHDLVAPTPSIAGIYQVAGRNPDGSSYGGVVKITALGRDRYRFDWTTGGTYTGTGTLTANEISVDWGADAPAIYKVNPDGSLSGTWANGRASESLRPDPSNAENNPNAIERPLSGELEHTANGMDKGTTDAQFDVQPSGVPTQPGPVIHPGSPASYAAGTWTGTMECHQGSMAASLEIVERGGELLTGTFSFSPLGGNDMASDKRLAMEGRVSPDGQIRMRLIMEHGKRDVDLRGSVSNYGIMKVSRPLGLDCRDIELRMRAPGPGNEVCSFAGAGSAMDEATLGRKVDSVEVLLQRGEIETARAEARPIICDGNFAVSGKARQFLALSEDRLQRLNHIAEPAWVLLGKLREKPLPQLNEEEKQALFLYAMLAFERTPCLAGRLLMLPALKGHALSLLQLGRRIGAGAICGMKADPKSALDLFRSAAERGSRDGKIFVGVAYIVGLAGGVPEVETGEALLAEATAEREADAQYLAGVALASGMGLPAGSSLLEGSKARELQVRGAGWLLQAARQGHVGAQLALGDLLEAGIVPSKQEDEKPIELSANGWYEAAADQGAVEGTFRIGRLRENRMDFWGAMAAYRKAADQGHAPAQTKVGIFYREGKGVSKDAAEAVKWFQASAAQGHPAGQAWLGYALLRGEGVQRNVAEAATLLSIAASAGDVLAQQTMVTVYEQGLGVQQDPVYAEAWLDRAAASGSAWARQTIQERETLQRLVVGFLQNWQPAGCDTFYGFSCNRGADMLGYHMFMGK